MKVLILEPHDQPPRESLDLIVFKIHRGLKISVSKPNTGSEPVSIPNPLPHLLSGVYTREAYAIASWIRENYLLRVFKEIEISGSPILCLTIIRYLKIFSPSLTVKIGNLSKPQRILSFLEQEKWLYAEQKCKELSMLTPMNTNKALPSFEICIAHYNHGAFLSELLKSLTRQTYLNFTVCIVDDGSTDPSSKEEFQKLRQLYQPYGWKFIEQSNQGPSIARNMAVKQSSADYLVFMDSDNLAAPKMLEVFAKAIIQLNMDCISCWFTAFKEEGTIDTLQQNSTYVHCPLGGSNINGLYENVYGDTNFAIRRSVFNELGGFSGDRSFPWEDWLFLLKLNLQLKTFDVVPETLFYYRLASKSRSRAAGSSYKTLKELHKKADITRYLNHEELFYRTNSIALSERLEALDCHIQSPIRSFKKILRSIIR
jgi:glycosyltransferase involved in cell wall biosynthesis